MKRILIVEDDAVLTSIYQQQYKAAGYDVATATDGEMGLLKVQTYRPDVVQVDLLIPKINGVELIKRLRLQPEFKQLPVVVLTSCYHEVTVKQAWAAGANKVISKLNSSPRLLLETLENLLLPPPPEPSPNAGTGSPLPSPCRSQPGMRDEFLERIPQFQSDLRSQLQAFIKAHGGQERSQALDQLYQTIRCLVGHAGMSGFVGIFQIGAALEGLLQQLQCNPEHVTASVIRTIANAMESLSRIMKDASQTHGVSAMASLILCVDDEPISRQLINKALQRVDLKAVNIDDPSLALQVLARNRFDLIFLDIDMPGMDGFALCKQIRAQAVNQDTPVIFVTSFADFDHRARSALSGGNDLIAKPFLPMELALKALTYVTSSQQRA
jgi:CheY-like chemotaxis protein